MVSKVASLNLGILAILVLISSLGEARDLANTFSTFSTNTNLATEKNDVGELKNNEKSLIGGKCAENSDCFMIPGWPSFPGINIPGIGIPGIAIPGIGGLPSGPKTKLVGEKNNVGELKNNEKLVVGGRCAEGSDCFMIPGLPSIPGFGIPGFGVPSIGIPGIGVPGIGIPRIGVPGIGIPGIGVPGIGIPGIGVPGIDGLPHRN